MQIRSACPADEPSFCSLWQRAFGDSEEFARFVFTRYAGCRHIYVAEEEGAFAAILCAIPGMLGDHPGAYFYGLATEPDFRRRGVMSGLIDWACRAERTRGAQFALLVPAGAGLFDYYAKRGFRTAFYRCVELVPRPARSAPVCTLRPPRAASYFDLQEAFLPAGRFLFNPGPRRAIISALSTDGAQVVETAEGFALFAPDEGENLVCWELGAASPEGAAGVLAAAADALELPVISCRLPWPSPAAPHAPPRPYAMVRFLDAPFDLGEAPYLALDLGI